MRLVYPEIEGGRVVADVEVEKLGDYFVGERTRVYVTTGNARGDRYPARLRIPTRRPQLRQAQGRDGGRCPTGRDESEGLEILSGLKEGDVVVAP